MAKFIEVLVSDDQESKSELINMAHVGRIYPNPQWSSRSIIEMNYHSVNQSPVYLEVDMSYETLKNLFLIGSEKNINRDS